jgi:hypothetical protein
MFKQEKILNEPSLPTEYRMKLSTQMELQNSNSDF